MNRPCFFLFPVLAILLAWITWRASELTRTGREVERIEDLLLARIAPSTSAAAIAGSDRAPPADGSRDGGSLLRRISAEWKHGRSAGDLMTRLRLFIAEASAEELEALLDELAKLDSDGPRSAYLESLIADSLADKAPDRLLERYSGRFHEREERIFGSLIKAMKNWAAADPLAAAAWLDREIAAGHFESTRLDGKSFARNQAEFPVVNALLRVDPAAAKRRIEVLPPEHRPDLAAGISAAGVDPALYGDLIRSTLSNQNEIRNAFMNGTHLMEESGADYDDIGRFLQKSGATPDIRTRVVEQTVGKYLRRSRVDGVPTAEALATMHAWVKQQDPGTEDKTAAENLADSLSLPRLPAAWDKGAPVSAVADRTLEFHRSSGSDEFLAHFISAASQKGHTEEARKLIPHLKDPSLAPPP